MELVVGLLCVVLIGLVGLAAWAAARRRARHLREVHDWARSAGWTVTPDPAVDWGERLPGGNRRGVKLLLSGTARGRTVHVAEYEVTDTQFVTTSDGQGGTTVAPQSNTHHYLVVVVPLRHALPDTTVEARGRKSTFDKAFRIRTSAPEAVPSWCTPPVMAAHMDGHVLVPWHVHGHELMHFTTGRLEPERIMAYAESLAWLGSLLEAQRRP